MYSQASCHVYYVLYVLYVLCVLHMFINHTFEMVSEASEDICEYEASTQSLSAGPRGVSLRKREGG